MVALETKYQNRLLLLENNLLIRVSIVELRLYKHLIINQSKISYFTILFIVFIHSL